MSANDPNSRTTDIAARLSDAQRKCDERAITRARCDRACHQFLGRSKGGLSTKIHARTDALGNPTGFYLTGGQASDLVGADHLLVDLEVEALLADKAYDAAERVLDVLEACGAIAVIPPKRNRLVQRAYDKELYKARHLIENFFSKIKQFRAIATRYDKLSRNFLAGVHLASACVLLN
ncbi:IS5 family transposase [Rhabdochromatium marinum]|uniref:IS5 family transposase n=1 Tax=Rhabdochromatium marinum TaxID=48729 RepID=UPI0019080121|nr:hypothetical protein [Rhabdochromatium marinum]